ncbi:MAG: fibrobacter succinogenes major paralogous domain-containing protein [Candidatus Symbiothrix sp.]|jgi:hypothetical protein|nr:fibrobacter succinogenes major paralogous domain-containing protein [Candidatus Symbiothrix sp.]
MVYKLTFLACLVAGSAATAQVNIGTLDTPHRASLLHLRTSSDSDKTDSLGVKLPAIALPDTAKLHLGDAYTNDLDVDETATGMIVFNKTNNPCAGLTPCLYVWDGATWHAAGCTMPQCVSDANETCLSTRFPLEADAIMSPMIATIPIDDGEDYNDEGYLQFLTFNLGADPTLSSREQIAFCDDKTEDASFTDPFNVALYGGFYQWGRNNDGSQFRCQKTEDGANDDLFSELQIDGGAYELDPLHYSSQFVWTHESMNPQFDWITPSDPTLWGNGLDADNQPATHSEADANRDWNDPCPDHWRVPTQYEWRLITGEPYEINPSSSQYGYFVPVGNPNLVWVRFSDGNIVTVFPKKDDNKDDAGNYFYNNGYAIFDKHSSIEDVLGDVFAVGRKIEEIVEAEPLMYIPAVGYRLFADARVEGVGETGYYWTATNIGEASAKYIQFHNTGLNPDDAVLRSTGCSVRCVKML